MKIEFHPEAAQEFVEASQFYETRVPGLGEKFVAELQRLSELLSDRPDVGARIDKTFRRAVFRRFPFLLIYSVEVTRIWVMAVAHQRRRPGYWRQRRDR